MRNTRTRSKERSRSRVIVASISVICEKEGKGISLNRSTQFYHSLLSINAHFLQYCRNKDIDKDHQPQDGEERQHCLDILKFYRSLY